MATTLIGLSDELKLSIYGRLEDLDVALHLSQTNMIFICPDY